MKANKNSDARQRIVETASKLFYTQGYNSTGINQIIEDAEVAKASLYQHFPAKEDLLVEYLNLTAEATNEALRDVMKNQNTPKEKILSTFDFLVHFSNSVEFEGCNFLKISAETPKDNSRIRDIIRVQKDGIRSLFKETLATIGKENLADQLYVLFDGALATSRVHNDTWPILAAKQTADQLL